MGLFGENFFGINTLTEAGLKVPEEDKEALACMPWTLQQLQQYKINYMLVAMPIMSAAEALWQFRKKYPTYFLDLAQEVNSNYQIFHAKGITGTRWLLVRRELRKEGVVPVKGSRDMTIREFIILNLLCVSKRGRLFAPMKLVSTADGVHVLSTIGGGGLKCLRGQITTVPQSFVEVLDS